jgi:hypothetical protein
MPDDVQPNIDPILIDPISVDPKIDPLITPDQKKELDAKEQLLRDEMVSSEIPAETHDEIVEFIMRGVPLKEKGLVRGVFSNDLFMSFMYAGDVPELVLTKWFNFFLGIIPGDCQGSAAAVASWPGFYEQARKVTVAAKAQP